jgi:hypothetical protein
MNLSTKGAIGLASLGSILTVALISACLMLHAAFTVRHTTVVVQAPADEYRYRLITLTNTVTQTNQLSITNEYVLFSIDRMTITNFVTVSNQSTWTISNWYVETNVWFSATNIGKVKQ